MSKSISTTIKNVLKFFNITADAKKIKYYIRQFSNHDPVIMGGAMKRLITDTDEHTMASVDTIKVIEKYYQQDKNLKLLEKEAYKQQKLLKKTEEEELIKLLVPDKLHPYFIGKTISAMLDNKTNNLLRKEEYRRKWFETYKIISDNHVGEIPRKSEKELIDSVKLLCTNNGR